MYELVTWPRNPWSLFDELESLQTGMNWRLTRQASDSQTPRSREWRRRPTYPLMNVWTSTEGIIIDTELPGVDPKDVDISVMGDELTIRGKVNTGEPVEGEIYHRRERPEGEFARSLQLPFGVNAEAVKANYTDGVLRLIVPRSEDEKPRKITIEAA